MDNLVKIEKPKCTFPEGKIGLFLGIVQFIFFLWLLFSLVTQNTDSIIGILVISGILGFIGYFTSSTIKYMKNMQSREQLQQYIEKVLIEKPEIRYDVSAYHNEERQSENGTQTVKVYTFKDSQSFPFQSYEDKSADIQLVYTNNKMVRVKSEFNYWKGSQLTENNYNLFVSQMKQNAALHDKYVEGREVPILPSLKKEILSYPSSIPCFLNVHVALVLYLLGFMLLFDIIFFSSTAKVFYQINKVIYSDQLYPAQQMQQQFNQNQQNLPQLQPQMYQNPQIQQVYPQPLPNQQHQTYQQYQQQPNQQFQQPQVYQQPFLNQPQNYQQQQNIQIQQQPQYQQDYQVNQSNQQVPQIQQVQIQNSQNNYNDNQTNINNSNQQIQSQKQTEI